MPGGGPTALCPDSVMPRQRYAFPALCLAATGWCLPKITTCPRNRSSGGFYNYLCFITMQEQWKIGDPPLPPKKESIIDCKLPIKTIFLANTWNEPMTHSFDLPLTLDQTCTEKQNVFEQRLFSLSYRKKTSPQFMTIVVFRKCADSENNFFPKLREAYL